MQIRNRKRLVLVLIRGGILVLIALILEGGRLLAPLESLLYDQRVRHCQGYQPPPAPQLVHLDVDDSALAYIGHWPWPSRKLARIIDEITLAKPKLLAMDVISSEPTTPDADNTLADSYRRLGCALIPMSLNFDPVAAPSKLRRLLLPLLTADPERTQAQCLELLRDQGITQADFDRDPGDSFLTIREAAFFDRIWSECVANGNSLPPRQVLEHKLLPHEDLVFTGSVLGRLFNDEYNRVVPQLTMLRFTLPATVAGTAPVLPGVLHEVPILPLGLAARYSGFVNYLPETVEATVRTVPLLARYRDRIIPHMGLVAACVAMGADVHDIRLGEQSLTIHRPDGREVAIPISVRHAPLLGDVGALMEVPLFGRPGDWQTAYDVPAHQKMARHVSTYEIWQICQTLDQLNTNSASIDRVLEDALAQNDPAQEAAYEKAPLTGAARRQLAGEQLDVLNSYVQVMGGVAGLPADQQKLIDNANRIRATLPALLEQSDKLDVQLQQLRGQLYQQLHDRVVFFGSTATGLDVQHTSLFGLTPGVLIHGAVFNAIFTGKMWRRTSDALGLWLTAGLGLTTLAMMMLLPPTAAFAGAVLLGGGYLALNGYVLFARDNLIVSAAGPLAAVVLVWAGMTLGNYITEVADRARITRRFRSYVDPTVVDYYVDHPEHVRFDGERRELTVGFSDLAGFTTLTDELGEKVVPLLQEYVGAMVPVIRSNQGTMDKQIGDGLCFFFGAPRPDDQHAAHAVQTALDMHAALAEFNRVLAARGEKTLGMRIGLATGDVIVGDAGPPNASSYTTLGGTTNLAARLESVNKLFGTHTLVSARTVELLGGHFLVRPIANIRVAGKLNCVVVYEPICPIARAGPRDRELVQCTERVFHAYRVADFGACIRAAHELQSGFGTSKFAKYYLHLAANPPADLCEGQIMLNEK